MAKRAATKFPSVDEYLELFAAPSPPSGALINAVLEHADIREELGGGRVVLRLSERRANHRLVRRGLGRQAGQLGKMALIWDEIDERIVQVCNGVAEDVAAWEFDEMAEYDRFELTEAALAYVADHEHRAAR